ncbi:tRNA (guanosine(37)-N1)-methyltransferase TrmD [Patescibacteria group bacterium]|nr:tRNA (guanosine(37)-N1)-methyltransferase TrmD [Patescibacteria group bacterium]
MNLNIFTLYPDYFISPFNFGILKKALSEKLVNINVINLREFAYDKRGSVDDTPYGGGAGMVLRVDVLHRALESVKSKNGFSIMLSPAGKRYNQKIARKLSVKKEINIFSGRFEGFDERFLNFVDMELSLGDFVLSGGESASLVVIDSVVRLIPGVLGNEKSLDTESFSLGGLLEYPQYTKPKDFMGFGVPEVLLSGDHKKIDIWRKEKSLQKTKKRV